MSIAEQSSVMTSGTRPRVRRMTKDLILSGTTFPRNRDESTEHYLDRITHLHLQSKKIRRIEGLDHANNLQVLYLYDNYIEVIENISQAKKLKCLFISNNLLTRIPNIDNVNLEKLRLDDNEIGMVQGLEECERLQELSIANQRIGAELQFDYHSLRAIAGTLKYLDISGNKITTLSPLICLENLENLNCADNQLAELVDLEPLQHFPYLEVLNLKGNPVCKVYRYKDTLIGYCSINMHEVDEMPLTRKNIDSMRAVQVHRQKVQFLKSQRKAHNDDLSQEGGLDAKRTFEDTNDYKESGAQGGDDWAALHL